MLISFDLKYTVDMKPKMTESGKTLRPLLFDYVYSTMQHLLPAMAPYTLNNHHAHTTHTLKFPM